MNYINELIEMGIGSIIDMSIDKIVTEDEIYKKNIRNSEETFDKLVNTLSKEQKNLLDEYMTCMMSTNERIRDLTYLTGVKNTIRFLAETNSI